ncbi:MAG: hypothetical protein FJ137_00760 [Deltaproteobacteria bacterium]|nr:hypothetical protein [Deltaproteobacteria bacterium]
MLRARFGLARVSLGKRAGLALVVVSDVVELSPFPEDVAASLTLRLRGRALDPLTRPRLYVLQPDGTTTMTALKPADDGSFEAAVSWPLAGRAFLELRGGSSAKSRSIARKAWSTCPSASMSRRCAPSTRSSSGSARRR